MSKIRLNQYSQFEIECLVNGEVKWRLALKQRTPNGHSRFVPDFDEEREILQETHEGDFIIIAK